MIFSGDALMCWIARGAAAVIILMLVSLVFVLARAAVPSMRTFGWRFLTNREWRPNERVITKPVRDENGELVYNDDNSIKMRVVRTVPADMGAAAVIYGTAISSLLALVLAVPLSIGCALFLVRVAPKLKIAGPVSFLVEFLAAIPSIAYGIWGLFVLVPLLQNHVEPWCIRYLSGVPGLGWMFTQSIQLGNQTIVRTVSATGRDMLCGGTILAIMIVPIITAVSRDVLRAVPRAQIEGSLALGANWWQSCRHMLHYSRSGLFGAIMLGLARAAGETMAVTMVIGNNTQISASIFAPAQTMSSLLANQFADADGPCTWRRWLRWR